MRRVLLGLLVVLAFVAAPIAAQSAKPSPFVTAKEVDLVLILPPPPAADSAQTRQELAELLTIQVTRTPEAVARARADAVEDVWRFQDVVGAGFVRESLPITAAFFLRLAATEGAVVDPAKDAWGRARPPAVSDLIRPCVDTPTSGSYPSGHTTLGTMMGMVLADMLPEQRRAIMTRAWEYGANRMMGGVHFRSDVEAGRLAAGAIVTTLFQNATFVTQFAAARNELRTHLGLEPIR